MRRVERGEEVLEGEDRKMLEKVVGFVGYLVGKIRGEVGKKFI
jgi:hypothetical protein